MIGAFKLLPKLAVSVIKYEICFLDGILHTKLLLEAGNPFHIRRTVFATLTSTRQASIYYYEQPIGVSNSSALVKLLEFSELKKEKIALCN